MSIDLTLHRIEALLSRFPPYTRPTIHIAGTNGKGSVSAILTSIFLATNPPSSVGRFNSPHLVSILDCITIDDKPVSQAVYMSIRDEVDKMNFREGTGASSFELLTITALLIFERSQVDIVICEVGMGGRLDATNVIPDDAIMISVITSVDLDHQAFLGSTVSSIAREKAGIARKGTPLVISFQNHEDVIPVVKQVTSGIVTELIIAQPAISRDWDEQLDGPEQVKFSLSPFQSPPARPVLVQGSPSEPPTKLLLPLQGDHQLANLGVAWTVVETLGLMNSSAATGAESAVLTKIRSLTTGSIRRAVEHCTWPGRLSFHSYPPEAAITEQSTTRMTVLVDGAHNQASSQTLADYIQRLLASLTPSRTKITAGTGEPRTKPIGLTYILGLSHSPPKTANDVLEPLLKPAQTKPPPISAHSVNIGIAIVRFTPPEGMPWVKSISPSHLANCVRALRPDVDLHVAPDDEVSHPNNQLNDALAWAAKRTADFDGDNLVVVAGSLYLVADFYRALQK
ncbi:Mur ligase [Rickenella mellea]|uniref:Mur ligase n=1 Tax=Rickenella mellea TaxID=50990 RepID=A0A4Y7QI91_9AGAM|nr:Mur ligase [Rickenella mellea]